MNRAKAVNISHSKLKNSGILFEMLVRQITTDVLTGNSNSPALTILEKYFNVNTELGKELQLYQAFFAPTNLTENRAGQYLDMVVEQRKKLNESKLAKEKYELIKEIKNSYNLKEFLSCKIPSYKIYASIYKTFLTEQMSETDSIINIQEVASARFALIEHMIGSTKKSEQRESALINEFKNQTEDLRLLSYKIYIDKFNEKYNGLDENQKSLLREYINDISSKTTLIEYIQRKVPILVDDLKKKSKSVDNRVLQIKLNEVVSQLNNIQKKKFVKDNEITAIMIAYQINRELDQHE